MEMELFPHEICTSVIGLIKHLGERHCWFILPFLDLVDCVFLGYMGGLFISGA